jgi:RimJ/RimL family protein N-acetyltransferase
MSSPILTVEPLVATDADALWAALRNPRVRDWIPDSDEKSLEAVRARVAHVLAGPVDGSGQVWLNRTVRVDGVVIGRVEATLHDGIVEIAYLLGPAWWGKGYASEAVGRLLDELEVMGAGPVWAAVAAGNERSVALLRRLGFVEAEPSVPLLSADPGDITFVQRALI